MQTTPVKKGRGVLRELPNGHDIADSGKSVTNKDDVVGAPASAEKRHPSVQLTVVPSGRPPLYGSPAVHRRSSLAANNSKRIRQSPSTKRVSFGGDTINIISQHPKEFRSPDADTPPGAVSSPPRKSRKVSHLSSPAVRRSPAFTGREANLLGTIEGHDDSLTLLQPRASPRPGYSRPPRPRLDSRAMGKEAPSLLGDDAEDDDTLNLPKSPRISINSTDAGVPPSPMPITEPSSVALRRNSVANARQSFGIFLDDDISRGQGDVDLTDENDPSFLETRILSSSGAHEVSDDDITQDLGANLLDKLRDNDESSSANLATDTGSQRPMAPPISPSLTRVSRASSRQSLGLLVTSLDVNEGSEIRDDTTQRRWSMAPASDHLAALDNDAASRRFSIHGEMQMGDILQQLEQDETDDDVTMHFPSEQRGEAESEPATVNENVSEINTEASTEQDIVVKPDSPHEEHDEVCSDRKQAAVTDGGMQSDDATRAHSLDQSENDAETIPPVDDNDQNLLQESLGQDTASKENVPLPNSNGLQTSSRSPPQEKRRLFQFDDTDTIHFHDAHPIQKRKPAAELINQPPTNAKGTTSASEGPGGESPGVRKPSVRDDGPYLEKAQKLGETSSVPVGTESTSEHQSSNAIATPQSEVGKRVRACVSERFVPSSLTKLSTPLSAPGSKIRSSACERKALQRKDGTASQTEGPSESAVKLPASKTLPTRQEVFSMVDFLGSCNLRFEDHRIQCTRDPSFLPEVLSSGMDRASAEWRILQYTKRECYLKHLKEQVRLQKAIFSSTVEHISSLENEILRHSPPVFSFMSKNHSRPGKAVTNCRVGLKRLRKVCHFTNRLDWVLSRQKWESDIRSGLEESADACQADGTTIQGMKRSIAAQAAKMTEALTRMNFKWTNPSPGVGDLAMRQEQLVNKFAHNSKVRALITSDNAHQKQDTEKYDMLLPKKSILISNLRELELYAGAQADRKLKLKVQENAERNFLLCDMSGIQLDEISASTISGSVCGLVQFRMVFSGDAVKSVEAHPISTSTNCGNFLDSYTQGAVSLARDQFGAVKTVKEVPFALHSSVERLTHAINLLRDVTEYFDGHIGEAVNAKTLEGDFPCIEVNLIASFYSLKSWTKFDVDVTLSTSFSRATGSTQDVKDLTVRRFIGDAPSDDTIRETFLTSGFRKNSTNIHVQEAFAGVWELL